MDFKPFRSIQKIRADGKRKRKISAICGARPCRGERVFLLFCALMKNAAQVGVTAGQWHVCGKYMRIISCWGDNNMQLCLYLSCQSHTFRKSDKEMMDTAEMRSISALNPLPAEMTIGLYHSVRAHPYHRGQSTPWDGLLSEWFLPASTFLGQIG